MIITGSRISTSSGAGKTGSHVFSGAANEAITPLQGTQQDLDDMVRDAREHGSKYALRHWKVSPKEGMTSADLMQAARELAHEFGADPERLVVIEHQKKRAGGLGFERHGHVIAPEYDPVAGRILDAHWMRPRHEKIARVAENRLGHEHVPGRWNAAVARALTDEGKPELAARVDALAALPRPESGYSAIQHQTASRRGLSLPHDRIAVATAWQGSDSAQAFAAALAEQGITMRQGDKPGTYIAERDGQLVGAVHRLVGAKKGEVAERLAGADLRVPEPGQPAPEPTKAARGLAADLAPAVPDRGQPTPGTTVQASTPAPAQPAAAASEQIAAPAPAAVASRDARPAASGGGGGGSASASSDSGGGASLADVGDGPGPPPGPEAHPDERAKWLEKLASFEDRKASAWKAWIAAGNTQSKAATPACTAGGQDNAAIQRQAEAAQRLISDLFERWERAGSAAEIRRAIARFEADSARVREHAAAGRDDRATSGELAKAGQHDTGNPSPRRDGSGHVGGPDRAEGHAGAEPDRGNPGSPHGDSREPDSHRAAIRAAVADAAAQARIARALDACPEALERLRAATAALQQDPFADLKGRASYEAIASAREGLYARYTEQKASARNAGREHWRAVVTEQRAAGDRLACSVREAGRHARHDVRRDAYAAVKAQRTATVETLKTAPKPPTFDEWLERQGRTDPSARAVAAAVAEHRERKTAAEARLTADRARIAAVLSTHPHPDPRDRDPQARATRYAGRLSDGYRGRVAAVQASKAEAEVAMQSRSIGTRLLAAMGISTTEQRRAEQADACALKLGDEEERLRPTPQHYAEARADGAAHAYAAIADTAAWQVKPEVAKTFEHARLNKAVDSVAQEGDPQVIRALKAGDPDGARAVILAREEAERRAADELERRRGFQRVPGHPQGPDVGGPPGPGELR